MGPYMWNVEYIYQNKIFDGFKFYDVELTFLEGDNDELDFIKEIGLQEHLSPTRSNGLVAMVKQMKIYALALNN